MFVKCKLNRCAVCGHKGELQWTKDNKGNIYFLCRNCSLVNDELNKGLKKLEIIVKNHSADGHDRKRGIHDFKRRRIIPKK